MNPPNIIKAKTQSEFQSKVLSKKGVRVTFQNKKGFVFGATGRPQIFSWVEVK